jgi:hypothetical protein
MKRTNSSNVYAFNILGAAESWKIRGLAIQAMSNEPKKEPIEYKAHNTKDKKKKDNKDKNKWLKTCFYHILLCCWV